MNIRSQKNEIIPSGSRDLVRQQSNLVKRGLNALVGTADQPIRVLVVDDIWETRENIRHLLQYEEGIEVVGGAATGFEGLWRFWILRPDVVSTNIHMPDMDGITMTARICEKLPARIFMLSVNNDSGLVRRAMRAGARDFLAKPPRGDEYIELIRNLAALPYHSTTVPRHDTQRFFYNISRNSSEVLLVPIPHGEVIPTESDIAILSLAVDAHPGQWTRKPITLSAIPTIQIDTLDLRYTHVEDRDLLGHRFLKGVRNCDLLGTQVGGEEAQFLQSMDNLERLSLRGARMSPGALSHLSGRSRLKSLNISNTDLTDSMLPHLHRLPQLERLELEENNLTGENFRIFERFPSLRHVMLHNNPISPEGFDLIFELLRSNPGRQWRFSIGGEGLPPNARDRVREYLEDLNYTKADYPKITYRNFYPYT